MKYNWGIKEIQQEQRKIVGLINATTDLRRKIFLKNCLADLDDAVFSMTFKKDVKQSQEQSMIIHTSNLLTYKQEYDLAQIFYEYCALKDEKMDEIDFQLICRYEENLDVAKATNSYITEDKALSIMHDFFKHLDKELYETFKEAYKDRFNYLRFRPPVEDEGRTLFVYGTRKNFITVQDSKEGKKLFSLIHEYAHAVHNLLMPETAYELVDCSYVEIPSIFLELVALYENPANFNPLYISYLNYINLTTYVDFSFQLSMHKPIINLWKSNNYNLNRNFYDNIERKIDINRKEFNDIMNCFITEEGVYVVSYFVALKLFSIYKRDKKVAIELYKKFLKLPTNLDTDVFVAEIMQDDLGAKKEIDGIVDGMSLALRKQGD